jgi:metal-responsive CopG/Arc/MetJ family transcriptional regulator
MKPRKKEEDKKIKFAISLDPKLFKRMDKEMINKSRLIENLIREYYGNKDLH